MYKYCRSFIATTLRVLLKSLHGAIISPWLPELWLPSKRILKSYPRFPTTLIYYSTYFIPPLHVPPHLITFPPSEPSGNGPRQSTSFFCYILHFQTDFAGFRGRRNHRTTMTSGFPPIFEVASLLSLSILSSSRFSQACQFFH